MGFRWGFVFFFFFFFPESSLKGRPDGVYKLALRLLEFGFGLAVGLVVGFGFFVGSLGLWVVELG